MSRNELPTSQRTSCGSVDVNINLAPQIATTILPPKGGPSPVFWGGHPQDPRMWMAARNLLAGDIESNPGPKTNPPHTPTTDICPTCKKPFTNRQYSLLCHSTPEHWIHKSCAKTTLSQYRENKTWTCNLHQPLTSPPSQPTSTSVPQPTPTASSTSCSHPTVHPQSPSPPTLSPQPALSTHPIRFTQPPHLSPIPLTNPSHPPLTQPSPNSNPTHLSILQLNTNGILNKTQEINQFIQTNHPDIVTLQETKLTKSNKTPNFPGYATIRTDRQNKAGGGLITLVRNNITFTENKIPPNVTNDFIELQTITLHLSLKKNLNISNLYIPPRDSTQLSQTDEDTLTTKCFDLLTSSPDSIITGDINAHSSLWFSPLSDHRGYHIEDLITNSNHLILNTNCPTRVPFNTNQQSTSPDITAISSDLFPRATWETFHGFSSDHLPILTHINTKTKFRNNQSRKSYTNYNKANWTSFTEKIEEIIDRNPPPSNPHTANSILTNAILHADKHYIPKGKIQTHHIPLPENIRSKITERNEKRKANSKDPSLKNLNNTIDKLILTHRSELWQKKINAEWDHKKNTHILWNTISALSGKKQANSPNRTLTFNNKQLTTPKSIATAFNHQFTHATTYSTSSSNRKISKQIKNLAPPPTDLLTTTQVNKAIETSVTNKSTGPDGINIQHLKHLGPKAIQYLTALLNLSLHTNTIPQIWKLAKIMPVPKPNKDQNQGSSYRPISLLSPIAKTLEKAILPSITSNIPDNPHQHGFKPLHSTQTALLNITNTIIEGFNQKKPPSRTILVSLDLSKAFDTINIHKLLLKLLSTSVPSYIVKFLANYLRGRKAFTTFQNSTSKKKNLKTGVPQGSVLSPVLFNTYLSDLPPPPPDTQIDSYADDIDTLSSHPDYHVAQAKLQPYLNSIYNWTIENDLILNPDKSSSTLFTPDPAEYSAQLSLSINNTTIPTNKNPKILGVTFDPKLNFAEHISQVTDKAKKTITILKALTSTTWGKSQETITSTYKAITRPIMEYASPIWSTIATDTNLHKLQTIQNTALRIATGCTSDSNSLHLHHETNVLPVKEHLNLHASQLKLKALQPHHPLHHLTNPPTPPRKMKTSIFHSHSNTIPPPLPLPPSITQPVLSAASKHIHTKLVSDYISSCPNNSITNAPTLQVDPSEQSLPRPRRRTLAQLRTGKSPFLRSYLHHINPTQYSSDECPLCNVAPHTTKHLFECRIVPTHLTTEHLWKSPIEVSALLDRWELLLPPS